VARRKKSKLNTIYVISLGAHLAVGAVLALIPQQKLREVVAIALNEAPPKDEKKAEPPKPKEHPAERPARAATHVAHPNAAPQAAATSAAQAPAFTDLGLTLDSSASGGLAVNIQAPAAPVVAKTPLALVVTKPKVLAPRRPQDECTEPLIKARPLDLVRPTYTEDARRAHVQGRVRIELAVDDQGAVSGARIVEGLGYGLDEAALTAARRLRFAPARQCNRAVAAPFVIAMRFVLDT
jgi:periplasmic protein TonB